MPLKIKRLEITTAHRGPISDTDPVQRRRRKMVEGINQQIALLNDPEPDSKSRPWAFRANGKLMLHVKYGSRNVPLDDQGGNALVLRNEEDLVPLLEAIRESVTNGDLDGELEELSKNMGPSRKTAP